MSKLQPRDKVLCRNFKTGNETTVFYFKATNPQYMRMCDLVCIDPRVTGESPVAPLVKKSPEQEVKELQQEMGITENVEGIEFVESPEKDLSKLTVKELKAIADERGITYAKTAGQAKMLELLK